MAKQRKVVFGRINRRNSTLTMRPFIEDMHDLAESKRTSIVVRSTSGTPARTWHAADMKVTSRGAFMIGVIGYSVSEEKRRFDEDSFSWIKGETEFSDAASEDTVAPFAVDLRENHRWVAFATSGRIRPYSTAENLGKILNRAAHDLSLVPADWECDLIVSQSSLHQWIAAHPRVRRLRRTIKFTNPGLDLDEDRAQMRALIANRKTEEFVAYRGRDLDINSPEFDNKLVGTETGDQELLLESRMPGGAKAQFSTTEDADQTLIDDYGTDLVRGMDRVLAALEGYVSSRPAD